LLGVLLLWTTLFSLEVEEGSDGLEIEHSFMDSSII
jgi:hypothetical protein